MQMSSASTQSHSAVPDAVKTESETEGWHRSAAIDSERIYVPSLHF